MGRQKDTGGKTVQTGGNWKLERWEDTVVVVGTCGGKGKWEMKLESWEETGVVGGNWIDTRNLGRGKRKKEGQ